MASAGRTSTSNPVERNQEATVYVGGLDEKVSEELLWELMVQAAPVKHVYVPRDRITGQTQGYGFCEFKNEADAEYATKVMNMVRLFSKPIRVQQSSVDKRWLDVGANLFVGNLDPEVDEKLIYDTFSAFGYIIEAPYIMRDSESGHSKGFGFIKYSSFEASDAAIEAMSGQFLANRQIVVQYAYKKDAADGFRERHGTDAERLIAARSNARAPGSHLPATANAAAATPPQASPVQQQHADTNYPPRMPPPPTMTRGQAVSQYSYPPQASTGSAPQGRPPVGFPPGYHAGTEHGARSSYAVPQPIMMMPPPVLMPMPPGRMMPQVVMMPPPVMIPPRQLGVPYPQQPPPSMPPPPGFRPAGMPPNMPPPPHKRQ